MARRKSNSTNGEEVTSVRGHSVEDLYTIMREGRPYPEGVCRNFELNPPFFDCDDIDTMVPRPEAFSGGSVVLKSMENDRSEVVEVTRSEAPESTSESMNSAE